MFDAHFPDVRMLSSALAVLTAMITPAILILAAGTLIGSTSARLGRVVDRVRVLSDDFEALETGEAGTAFHDERRQHIFGQLDKLTSRARLLQRTMVSFYLALAAFVSTSVLIGLLALITPDRRYSPYIPVVVFLGGMGFMFAGSMLLILEARLATYAVSDEMSFILKVGRAWRRTNNLEIGSRK